jgi:hypothetical protein
MQAQKSHFNRNLLIILAALYAISIAAFSYANWAADPEFSSWWNTLLNILILSIPLVLLFGSIYLLVSAWREHAAGRPIAHRLAQAVHWAPRIAAILIIFFISLFSLDVFEMEAAPLELLGAFLIHSLPSILLIVLLVLAWKHPAVGFVAFLVFGVLFMLMFVRSIYALPNLLLFVLPILLIAGLFYADWKWLPPQGATPA